MGRVLEGMNVNGIYQATLQDFYYGSSGTFVAWICLSKNSVRPYQRIAVGDDRVYGTFHGFGVHVVISSDGYDVM